MSAWLGLQAAQQGAIRQPCCSCTSVRLWSCLASITHSTAPAESLIKAGKFSRITLGRATFLLYSRALSLLLGAWGLGLAGPAARASAWLRARISLSRSFMPAAVACLACSNSIRCQTVSLLHVVDVAGLSRSSRLDYKSGATRCSIAQVWDHMDEKPIWEEPSSMDLVVVGSLCSGGRGAC